MCFPHSLLSRPWQTTLKRKAFERFSNAFRSSYSATQSAEEADQHRFRIPDSGRNRKPINKKQISVTTYNTITNLSSCEDRKSGEGRNGMAK